MIGTFVAAVVGVFIASIIICCPGLHVYNIIGYLCLFLFNFQMTHFLNEFIMPFIIGLISGYIILSSISFALFFIPDESLCSVIMPVQRLVMDGYAGKAVFLMGIGSAIGAGLVFVFFAGLGAPFFHALKIVLEPHFYWILWVIIVFLLMTEWHGDVGIEQEGWKYLFKSFKKTIMGLVIFLLSAWLGFIMFYKSPLHVKSSFQNITPAFIGLFALPSLFVNIVSKMSLPTQKHAVFYEICNPLDLFKAGLVGLVSGSFAAFIPAVTGGVGGMLTNSVLNVKENKTFIIAQGITRMIYYAGGLLFMFMPGINLSRGAASWMFKLFDIPREPCDLWVATSCIMFSSSIAILILMPLCRSMIKTIEIHGLRRISIIGIVILCIVVVSLTGIRGLIVTFGSACVGFMPFVFGVRRINLLGFLLLPVACRMSGILDSVIAFLRLI